MFVCYSPECAEQRSAIVTPLFSYPWYSVIDKDILTEIKAEFFFYSKSLKQEFIVFVRQNNNENLTLFDFYQSNGKYAFTKRHSISGANNIVWNQVEIKVSPNGRYIAFIYIIDPNVKDETIGKVSRRSGSKVKRCGSQKSIRSKVSELNEGGSSSWEEAKNSDASLAKQNTTHFSKLGGSKFINAKIDIK